MGVRACVNAAYRIRHGFIMLLCDCVIDSMYLDQALRAAHRYIGGRDTREMHTMLN